MVIQRKQSVFLLLAAILMGVFCFMPIASFMIDEDIMVLIEVVNNPVYLVVNVLIATLLLLDIFLFKNFKLQKNVAKISMLLIVFSCIMGVMLASSNFENFNVDWCYTSAILPILSLILTYVALRSIKADEEKLKSYDRIR